MSFAICIVSVCTNEKRAFGAMKVLATTLDFLMCDNQCHYSYILLMGFFGLATGLLFGRFREIASLQKIAFLPSDSFIFS